MTQVAAPDHLGRRVRWHGQLLFCPPERCRAGAPVVVDRVDIAPGVAEIGRGVPIRPGDHGQITHVLGVTDHGDRCYRLTFDNGAVFDLVLPDDLTGFGLIEAIADAG